MYVLDRVVSLTSSCYGIHVFSVLVARGDVVW